MQDARRYGAERRGAPIFAYVRAARKTINERGIIHHPDLVIVADDTLVSVPAAGVLTGIDPRTVVLINSDESAQVWQHRTNIAGSVFALPLTADVEDRADLPYIGATCAGAAAQLLGVITRDALARAIESEQDQIAVPVPFYHCFGMVLANLLCLSAGPALCCQVITLMP